MNLMIGISIFGATLGLLSIFISLICVKKYRNQRELLEFNAKQIEDMEETLTTNKEMLESSRQKFVEQSRRVAWLETRIRQPRLLKEEAKEETVAEVEEQSPKSNITERRHRVLTLASRGQSPDAIAATLGMMQGEVELIINLNRAVAA